MGFSSIKKSSFENGPNLHTFFIQKFQAGLVNKNENDKVNKLQLKFLMQLIKEWLIEVTT